ncbi:hypothetical protein [Calothrix sp. UHCC 0171]|nr:hypothetical protein [Calothrix sp. UHCC 0171]MEA5573022.1 hypothetical protein [Calothrix sp. UHCC 0171]
MRLRAIASIIGTSPCKFWAFLNQSMNHAIASKLRMCSVHSASEPY